MEIIKCGLCGFEFERGVKICRGCQGRIQYGAGGLKWFFGIIYAVVVWFGLKYVNDNWFAVAESVAGITLLVTFLIGAIHASYLFKNEVKITKKVD